MASSSNAWIEGCVLSLGASVIGAASNLSIRQSYLLQQHREANDQQQRQQHVSNKQAKSNAPVMRLLPVDPKQADEQDEEDIASTASSSTSELEGADYNNVHERSSLLSPTTSDSPQPQRATDQLHMQPIVLRTLGVLGLSVVNPLLAVAAVHFASPSLLVPLGGLTLVLMVLSSEATIGESSSTTQRAGAALIVAGELVLTVFGDHSNDAVLTMDDLRVQYAEGPFVGYFVGLTVWMSLLLIFIRYGKPLWRRFAWGVCAGSVSGSSPFLKDVMAVLAGLMTDTVGTGDMKEANHVYSTVFSVEFGILVVLAALFPLASLILSMECMRRYDATYSAAGLLASQTVAATLMSAAHYRTWDHLAGDAGTRMSCRYVMYPLGLAVLLGGTVVLATDNRYTTRTCSMTKNGTSTGKEKNGPAIYQSIVTADLTTP